MTGDMTGIEVELKTLGHYRKFFPGLAAVLFILTGARPSPAQSTVLLPDETVEAVIAEVSGEIALHHEMMLGPFERIRDEKEYTGLFRETEYLLGKLKEYGFSDIRVEQFEASGTQWAARRGRLTMIAPSVEKLADIDETAAMLAGGSSNADITTDLVYVPNAEREESYKGIDVAGKIVIAEGSVGAIFRAAVGRFGAAGVCAFGASSSDLYPNLIPWASLPRAGDGKPGFGFNLHSPKGRELVSRLKGGEKITVRAEVDTRQFPEKSEAVTALIPGTDAGGQELLVVAHLFEGYAKQGANDNYSGAACILETGRALLELTRKGAIPRLKRSLRFCWVPEISGTRAYIRKHPDEIRRIIAAINMDMVGEDLLKTRSWFITSLSPWSVPSFFNDIVQEFAELTVALNNDAHGDTYGRFNLKITSPKGSQMPFLYRPMGYDTGSDHELLSNGIVRVPTAYFECWPDDFFHTSMDTPDKSDSTQLKRVAFIAAASLLSASSAGEAQTAPFLSLAAGKGGKRIAEAMAQAYRIIETAGPGTLAGAHQSALFIAQGAHLHEIENLKTIAAYTGESASREGIQTQVRNLEKYGVVALESLNNWYRWKARGMGIPASAPSLGEEKKKYGAMIPERKARGLIEQMDAPLKAGLPRSHPIFQFSHASTELENLIDGKRSIFDIASLVAAECGGPDIAAVAEYYRALEKKGDVIIR
jgi:aminopeptidase YwaD